MKKILADMHTHSENSHDSVCPIEEMALSQLKKGTAIFAVTDHLDNAWYTEPDGYAHIQNAAKTCDELNKKYEGKIKILKGVELGEGFWNMETYKKVMGAVDYDVILGSVHLVKYKDMTGAYSRIDFSKLSVETISEYVDAYFDDMITMIDTEDFDVLAHLTSTYSYTNGKYKMDLKTEPYEEKIETILRKIIEKGIALEVNTSSTELFGDFMPTLHIIKKYYDMGGCLITLGSDAHFSKDASRYFDNAVEFLKKTGFENIYYYEKRKPVAVEI